MGPSWETEPLCLQGWDVRAGLGGGTTFRRPRPSPSSLHLQLELSLEGWRHFLCPLPLISRHSWQAQRRGSKNREGAGAAIPLSAENLEVGGREDTQCPEKANRVTGAFPVVFLPLGCLPGHSTRKGAPGRDHWACVQAGRGGCPLRLHLRDDSFESVPGCGWTAQPGGGFSRTQRCQGGQKSRQLSSH